LITEAALVDQPSLYKIAHQAFAQSKVTTSRHRQQINR